MASLLVVFTAIHRVSVTLAASNRTTIYAAGFFPLSNEIEEGSIGRGVLPAVNLALEHINNSPVLRGYFLELKYNDTKCSEKSHENKEKRKALHTQKGE
ncbi:hypothetical protein B4U80_07642 [Leptotrombidium deliense]|uniref:Receptor ligand binding region domain-containing protein n=1 Tax=Leptotrombidium deliense TaxID=299467 RepID=A0A443SCN1_9ACAR|nr:hypothetical protein B4U80_07642 [Leptotrombidium deliense]